MGWGWWRERKRKRWEREEMRAERRMREMERGSACIVCGSFGMVFARMCMCMCVYVSVCMCVSVAAFGMPSFLDREEEMAWKKNKKMKSLERKKREQMSERMKIEATAGLDNCVVLCMCNRM